MVTNLNKISELSALYGKIHDCHLCPLMDREKQLRIVSAVDFNTDVFIISQALARDQLRMSGVNFFRSDGSLGNTGKNLEKFLNLFNRTVYPPHEVELNSGKCISRAGHGFQSVYNTEICQCYPGKSSAGGDRVPGVEEIRKCIDMKFLESEISIIKPKLILLMGNKSRTAFYRAFLGVQDVSTLGADINVILKNGVVPELVIGGRIVHYLPIQHASGVNPAFSRMLRNEGLVELIRGLLNEA